MNRGGSQSRGTLEGWLRQTSDAPGDQDGTAQMIARTHREDRGVGLQRTQGAPELLRRLGPRPSTTTCPRRRRLQLRLLLRWPARLLRALILTLLPAPRCQSKNA